MDDELSEYLKDKFAPFTIEGQISKLIELQKWAEGQVEILKLELEWRNDPQNKRTR